MHSPKQASLCSFFHLDDCTAQFGQLPGGVGKIIALVLTYNRKMQVSMCLAACLTQSEPPDYIFIFDNGSTDGTKEHLQANGVLNKDNIKYFSVQENIGPSAAFDQLFRLAWKAGCDWVWVMDDDVVPFASALHELKAAAVENFNRPEEIGLLASAIVSSDGRANNVPEIEMRRLPGMEPEWGTFLGRGLVKIRWSTLTSVLIPRSTFARIGSLRTDFYIAGDDIEFTLRITSTVPAYLVGKSVVTHIRQISGTYSILREVDPDRIRCHYFYLIRNGIYIRCKYYSLLRSVLYIGRLITEAFRALTMTEHRWLRVRIILFGIVSGIFFRPRAPLPFPLD